MLNEPALDLLLEYDSDIIVVGSRAFCHLAGLDPFPNSDIDVISLSGDSRWIPPEWIKGKTSSGGLRLEVEGRKIDYWSIYEDLLLKRAARKITHHDNVIDAVLETRSLNVEAVIVHPHGRISAREDVRVALARKHLALWDYQIWPRERRDLVTEKWRHRGYAFLRGRNCRHYAPPVAIWDPRQGQWEYEGLPRSCTRHCR